MPATAARPVRLYSHEAVGFGTGILLVPGDGCGRGARARHVVGAVEAAGDEVGVKTLELAVD